VCWWCLPKIIKISRCLSKLELGKQRCWDTVCNVHIQLMSWREVRRLNFRIHWLRHDRWLESKLQLGKQRWYICWDTVCNVHIQLMSWREVRRLNFGIHWLRHDRWLERSINLSFNRLTVNSAPNQLGSKTSRPQDISALVNSAPKKTRPQDNSAPRHLGRSQLGPKPKLIRFEWKSKVFLFIQRRLQDY